MAVPDPALPMFVYGIFQPGELGWLRIRRHVQGAEPQWSVRGTVRERDGLAILHLGEPGSTHGWLLTFDDEHAGEAYAAIAALEPDHHYRWAVTTAASEQRERSANVLAGRSPKRGSHPLDSPWQGRDDPLFTTGLAVVEEMNATAGTMKPGDPETVGRGSRCRCASSGAPLTARDLDCRCPQSLTSVCPDGGQRSISLSASAVSRNRRPGTRWTPSTAPDAFRFITISTALSTPAVEPSAKAWTSASGTTRPGMRSMRRTAILSLANTTTPA